MMIQSRELEALQRKIREAEDRLKARETSTVPEEEEASDQKNGASDSQSGECASDPPLSQRNENKNPV